MNNDSDCVWAFTSGFIFSSIIDMILVSIFWTRNADWQKQAIDNGVGRYNQTTSKFEWIKKE